MVSCQVEASQIIVRLHNLPDVGCKVTKQPTPCRLKASLKQKSLPANTTVTTKKMPEPASSKPGPENYRYVRPVTSKREEANHTVAQSTNQGYLH